MNRMRSWVKDSSNLMHWCKLHRFAALHLCQSIMKYIEMYIEAHGKLIGHQIRSERNPATFDHRRSREDIPNRSVPNTVFPRCPKDTKPRCDQRPTRILWRTLLYAVLQDPHDHAQPQVREAKVDKCWQCIECIVLGKMQRAEFNSKCVQVKLFARHQNPSLVDSC